MLEIHRLRHDRDAVVAGLAKRGFDPAPVARAVELDDRRKAAQQAHDTAQADIKALSREIGEKMKAGDRDGAEALKAEVAARKAELAPTLAEQEAVRTELEELLLAIPNVPHDSVPAGATPDDNEVYRPGPDPLPVLPEGYRLPHWELGEKYGLFDLKLGVKLAGAGFIVYRGPGARLQRALIAYFLDRAGEAGYEEVQVPHLVNEATARATGQLPDKEGQMYHVTGDDLYLIPTAEVPITNLVRDRIVGVDELPLRFCGYTPCFRREAGSYGAHVRGLNRVHQFDKVEIVRVEHPDRSYEALSEMVDHVAALLDALGLPYRVLRLCGGDMGFTSALTYDFEVWSAAQERWLEVSSVSNFETFQSNRLGLRVREGKDKRLAHTLNGSALALPRVLAALLENNQGPDGIRVPEVLAPYLGQLETIA